MAVGDIISDVGTVGAALNFQPAAGVEVMLTFLDNEGLVYIGKIAGGTPTVGTGAAAGTLNTSVVKIGITNTVFIQMAAVGGKYRAYSGVQTK